MYEDITPIHCLEGVLVKREDLACWSSLEHPSGSKVRQYQQMIANRPIPEDIDFINLDAPSIPPMLVGCSANSCQQVYVASAAKLNQTNGIIYVPKRQKKTDATKYCEQLGAEVNEIKPGYSSVIRKHARQRAVDLKVVIGWDRKLAVLDTAKQCENIPDGIKRIIVPTGSGLTAAGVLIGTWGRGIEIVAVLTSPMADRASIVKLASRYCPQVDLLGLGKLEVILPTTPYDKHLIANLPDGTPLDPFYAAKAWHLAEEGDLFWPPGLRPIMAMPDDCREAFKDWKGPTHGGL